MCADVLVRAVRLLSGSMPLSVHGSCRASARRPAMRRYSDACGNEQQLVLDSRDNWSGRRRPAWGASRDVPRSEFRRVEPRSLGCRAGDAGYLRQAGLFRRAVSAARQTLMFVGAAVHAVTHRCWAWAASYCRRTQGRRACKRAVGSPIGTTFVTTVETAPGAMSSGSGQLGL